MLPQAAVLPESTLVLNADGVPYSEAFGDVYHSADGGPAQARHVFLAGNDLPARWRGRHSYTILETGFGLGLNFLETWRALEEDRQSSVRLHFISVEKHPFDRHSLAMAHARWPEHGGRSQALLREWPLPLAGFHRLHFAGGRVTLTLLLGDAQIVLPQLEARADAFYLDGFSPARNPQLWSPKIFTQLARLAGPKATLASWTVAASVREGLTAAGFDLAKRPGFGAKREMLTGRYRNGVISAAGNGRKTVVIGAGLAGTACAHRLAARGWEVEVLERHSAAATEGSGNPVGFVAPLVNIADALNARLSRSAFGYAQRHFSALDGNTLDHDNSGVVLARGVLRILRDAREAGRFEHMLRERAFPPEFALYVDLAAASDIAGWPTAKPGLWFANGVSVDPARVCLEQLRQAVISTRFNCRVASVRATNSGWEVLDERGQVITKAPTVVIANAIDSLTLAPELRLESVRGQITYLPSTPERGIKVPVTGDGHAARLPDGRMLIGATFQPLDPEPGIRFADHAANIARIEAMLPGLCSLADAAHADGRVGFRTVTSDRLPIYGSIRPETPGLYVATGLGARGLTWAPLGAELLASQVAGDPWPVENEFAASLAPDRFRG